MIPVYDIDIQNRVINNTSVWRRFDEVILMQYTGLKDRCGLEIYEGDILELINEVDERVNAVYKFGKRRLVRDRYTIEI